MTFDTAWVSLFFAEQYCCEYIAAFRNSDPDKLQNKYLRQKLCGNPIQNGVFPAEYAKCADIFHHQRRSENLRAFNKQPL
ncbi:hypothetical protein A8C56_08110 [Niabella ginsenosidivorans]|uniref:Uncharacterized protein n=1 Tax=Niabella ginsenosidivorans TaxID=1176587 RepID=A0A1A9I2L1_9BACT|nr:hypothetical protein A8C56_08110 [Niabella ginsenosidivorans]